MFRHVRFAEGRAIFSETGQFVERVYDDEPPPIFYRFYVKNTQQHVFHYPKQQNLT